MENNELYHHGVKGMKWGHRKARPTTNASKVSSKKTEYDELKKQYLSAKTDKKAAYRTYSKTFNESQRLRNQFGDRSRSYNKKLVETAEASSRADKKYATTKKAYKQAKKAYRTELSKDNENYKPNFAEKYMFNDATKQRINKYLNSGVSLKEARTKTYISAGVNTAAVILAAYGASKFGDKLVSKFV